MSRSVGASPRSPPRRRLRHARVAASSSAAASAATPTTPALRSRSPPRRGARARCARRRRRRSTGRPTRPFTWRRRGPRCAPRVTTWRCTWRPSGPRCVRNEQPLRPKRRDSARPPLAISRLRLSRPKPKWPPRPPCKRWLQRRRCCRRRCPGTARPTGVPFRHCVPCRRCTQRSCRATEACSRLQLPPRTWAA